MRPAANAEEFATAAIRHAVFERLEYGAVGATVPGCPGVIAFGADQQECETEMVPRLIGWAMMMLAHDRTLPDFT